MVSLHPVSWMWNCINTITGVPHNCPSITERYFDKQCAGKILPGFARCTNIAVNGMSRTGFSNIDQRYHHLCEMCLVNQSNLQVWDSKIPENCHNKLYIAIVNSIYFDNDNNATAAKLLEPIIREILLDDPKVIFGLLHDTDTHVIQINKIINMLSISLLLQLKTNNICDFIIEFTQVKRKINIQRNLVSGRIFHLLSRRIGSQCNNNPHSHLCGTGIIPLLTLAGYIPTTYNTVISIHMDTLGRNDELLASVIPLPVFFPTVDEPITPKTIHPALITEEQSSVFNQNNKFTYRLSRRVLRQQTAIQVIVKTTAANLLDKREMILVLKDCQKC